MRQSPPCERLPGFFRSAEMPAGSRILCALESGRKASGALRWHLGARLLSALQQGEREPRQQHASAIQCHVQRDGRHNAVGPAVEGP